MELKTRQDILEFEKQPLPTLPTSVYEVLAASAKKYSDRTALHFFLQGTAYDRTTYCKREKNDKKTAIF